MESVIACLVFSERSAVKSDGWVFDVWLIPFDLEGETGM